MILDSLIFGFHSFCCTRSDFFCTTYDVMPTPSIESIVKLKSCFKLIAKFDFSNNNVVTFTTMCQEHKPQQFPTKYNKLKSTNRGLLKRSIKRSTTIQNGIPFSINYLSKVKSILIKVTLN